jgi:excinuclease ABC subunit B
LRRLQQTELAIGDDPMARQQNIAEEAGRYAGEGKYGAKANLPPSRIHKPTDADMGPHNFGGGEGRPRSSGGRPGIRAPRKR